MAPCRSCCWRRVRLSSMLILVSMPVPSRFPPVPARRWLVTASGRTWYPTAPHHPYPCVGSGPLWPDPAVGGGVWSARPRSGDRAVGGGHRAARGDRRLPADPYVAPARLEAIDPDEAGVTLALEGGARYRTRLLVAADGATPSCASISRCRSVATIMARAPSSPPSRPPRIPPDGPSSASPMEGRWPCCPCRTALLLVWSVPRDEAQGLLALDDAAFLARLQQAFGWRLGRIERTGVRHLYPLVLTVADTRWPSAPCWWVTPPTCCTPSPVRGSTSACGIWTC